MALVTIEIPRILQASAGGRARLELEADRLDAAWAELRRKWPVLSTHVFTETGELRPHVLLLHNDQLTHWGLDAPLAPGDRLEILQAVSGG
jgi:molybdopterin converting factor small subunit